MESTQNPFDLFEEQLDVDLHAVFKQEAYALLVDAEHQVTEADELFSKVDNLLTVASEMLEYNEYLDVVSFAFNCAQHDHNLQERLRTSAHSDYNHADHDHDEHKDEKEGKSSKAKIAARGFLFFASPPKAKKPDLTLFDILMGAK